MVMVILPSVNSEDIICLPSPYMYTSESAELMSNGMNPLSIIAPSYCFWSGVVFLRVMLPSVKGQGYENLVSVIAIHMNLLMADDMNPLSIIAGGDCVRSYSS